MTTVPDLVERARLLLAGELEPPPARPAATVALIRDGADGLEVYLLRRVRGMSFAAGMHVFPGGSVDPADRRAEADPGPASSGPASSGPASSGPADPGPASSGPADPGRSGWIGPEPSWWAARFGTDAPIGQTLRVRNLPFRVVGGNV